MLEPRGKIPGSYKSGDVVVIVGDEHQWSPAELSHPIWRVVKIPGLSKDALASFEVGAHKKSGHRKAVALDLGDALGQLLRSTASTLTLTPRAAFEALTRPVTR